MKKSAPLVLGLAVAALVAGIGLRLLTKQHRVSFFPRRTPVQCTPDNPYEYSIDSLTGIDPSQVGYREAGRIALSLKAKPQAIAIGDDNRLYAAGGNEISQLDSAGAVLQSISVPQEVLCLAPGRNGKLFAGSRNTIMNYGSRGKLTRQWNIGGENTFITSLCGDNEHLFIADAGMRVVWKLDTSGRVKGKIGMKDTSRGIPGFVVPSAYMDVAMGRDGSLWVVNPGRHLIENYRTNGDRLSAWGSSGSNIEGFCGCCGPIQMAMLPNGSFVTAEKGIVRVKVYDPAGRFATVVAPHAAFNPKESNLDLAVDTAGTIYVLDSYGNQIRVFRKKTA